MPSFLLITMLLTASLVSAAPSYSVFIAPAHYPIFTGNIRIVCGEAARACTDITAVALHASCRETAEGWEPAAAVTFRPVIHLPVAASGEMHELLIHEYSHIHDFYRSSAAYARSLTERRFGTKEACRAAALGEEAIFSARMAGFAQSSQALRR
jgi:hypothetical protein